MIYWKIIKSTHVTLSTSEGTRSINEGLQFEDHEKVIPYLQNRFGTKNLYFENSTKPLNNSEYTLLRNNDKQ